MLTITVSGDESFDDEKQEFVYPESFDLQLEHSLVSLSKWESIFEKPFLDPKEKTNEEVLAYVHLMILTPNVSPEVLHKFSEDNFRQINEYMNAKMTATWFTDTPSKSKTGEIITSELIYYWLTAFNIPIEAENWPLQRLFTVIQIANLKSQKPKKMGSRDAAAQQRELNAKRRAQMGTNG